MTHSTGLPRHAGGPGTDVDRRAGATDAPVGLDPAVQGAARPGDVLPTGTGAPPGTGVADGTPAQTAPAGPTLAGPTLEGQTPGELPAPDGRAGRAGRARRAVTVIVLTLVIATLAAATVHLYRTSTAWQDRADSYLQDARDLGNELASTREALSGTEAELTGVRAQLATAQSRIVALADEKAQIGDDREVQRQLVDYQARVSEAAGQVALALDQCVQGQSELIGYLQNTVTGTAQYDPAELERFRTDVEQLCQTATEANIALQRELSR